MPGGRIYSPWFSGKRPDEMQDRAAAPLEMLIGEYALAAEPPPGHRAATN